MTWIIVIVLAIVFFLFYNSYKGIKDIKYVEKSGGLKIKYQELIDFILTNEKLKLKQINSNNIEIGYGFIGNGHIKFKFTEMSKNLMVRYQSKDNVDGIQNLAWKFNENEPQSEMIEKISKDLFVHTQQLNGLSKNDALKEYSKIKQQKEKIEEQSATVDNQYSTNQKSGLDELYKFIVSNYKKLPDYEVLDIAQTQCNTLMINANKLLQKNLHIWDDDRTYEFGDKIQLYASINLFISSLKRGERNIPLERNKALKNINELILQMQKDTQTNFLNSELSSQQNIIEEVYIPHLLLRYVILNI